MPVAVVVAMNLDTVLRELEEAEPKVMVELELGAFCLVQARETAPPPVQTAGRLSLEVIGAYLANPF